ncbi:MAG: class I SAM-dependent methyltransferase [Clostridia bacterium]|nr:class I SAM-dependent methyltransferase [Clostridia bacterium]
MADFGGARKWARKIIEENLFPGAKAIDATMGNGYDTVWMAEAVGETGRVYAFDVQALALERTREKLMETGLDTRAELFLMGHENMALAVKCEIDAIVFNLGWLPGADKEKRTKPDTTLSAVNQALELLKPGGVLTICVYPGHDEGKREKETLVSWAEALDDGVFDAVIFRYANIKKLPPLLIAVTKRAK